MMQIVVVVIVVTVGLTVGLYKILKDVFLEMEKEVSLLDRCHGVSSVDVAPVKIDETECIEHKAVIEPWPEDYEPRFPAGHEECDCCHNMYSVNDLDRMGSGFYCPDCLALDHVVKS